MAFCSNCGNNLGSDAFCTRCGTRAGQPPVDHFERPPRGRWTGGKISAATGFLIGLAACGFLLTYFLSPLWHKDNTIPPPAPALAASSSESDTAAPAAGTDDGDAWTKLQRIAAQDRAALQGSQQWRAQLASSPSTESAADFLASYEQWIQKEPDALLAWSGDWPHSYAPSSRHSWVILSKFTKPTTKPVIDWCLSGNRGCWAKRLTALGEPVDNTDHPPADPSKN